MTNRTHTRKFSDTELLAALPSTISELAETFGVARSTIHRRLLKLLELKKVSYPADYFGTGRRRNGRNPTQWRQDA